MPSNKESAILRRKNDERVEILGIPCKLYRYKELSGGGKNYDEFDDPIISGDESTLQILSAFCIIKPYQEDKDIIGDNRGRQQEDFPFIGTFRWKDGVQKYDLVEVPYTYAQAAGLTECLTGDTRQPIEQLYTRFKIVNKRTRGINADIVLQFFLVPTEEAWN